MTHIDPFAPFDVRDRMKYLTLEKLKYHGELYLSNEFVEGIRVSIEALDQRLAYFAEGFVLKMVREVWASPAAEHVVEFPADWWQAFRQRWLPAWWLRRHPVAMKRAVLTAKHLYPKMAPVPGQKTITVAFYEPPN